MRDEKTEIKHHEYENYQYPDQFGKWLGYRIVSVNPSERVAQVELQITCLQQSECMVGWFLLFLITPLAQLYFL